MLKSLLKKYGIGFEAEVTEEEKKQELIDWLQFKADSSQSIQGSLEYLDDIRKLKEW